MNLFQDMLSLRYPQGIWVHLLSIMVKNTKNPCGVLQRWSQPFESCQISLQMTEEDQVLHQVCGERRKTKSLLASVLWAPFNLCSQSLKFRSSLSIPLLISTQFFTPISTLPLQKLALGLSSPNCFWLDPSADRPTSNYLIICSAQETLLLRLSPPRQPWQDQRSRPLS